ncbi:MAG: SGNH/GDSL hydrolase family protein [Phycisphaerae bacterium]|nr:SGNH/GDSL hydrolase family protein [Phycisphaerae bacterium]
MISILRPLAIAAAIACSTPLALAQAGPGPRAQPDATKAVAVAEAPSLLSNVWFIGASATAGFGVVTQVENHAPSVLSVPLAASFAGATTTPVRVHDLGSPFFFMSPGRTGRTQVDRALDQKASLIVGVDFLFWYVYGTESAGGERMLDESARLRNLETGLSQLDRFDAATPMVIGDLPDMHRAVGKMLSRAQMPKPETLTKANERIREWASNRKRTAVVSLAEIVPALNGKQPILAGGITFDPTKGALIQSDELHPTFRGSLALGLRVADAINASLAKEKPVAIAADEPTVESATKTAAAQIFAERAGSEPAAPTTKKTETGDAKAPATPTVPQAPSPTK